MLDHERFEILPVNPSFHSTRMSAGLHVEMFTDNRSTIIAVLLPNSQNGISKSSEPVLTRQWLVKLVIHVQQIHEVIMSNNWLGIKTNDTQSQTKQKDMWI